MHILVIEDDVTIQKLLTKFLATYGHVEVVSSGEEGLQYFFDHQTDHPLDVIFLDLMLPNMKGREVLDQIRAFESLQNIRLSDRVPIIILTSVNEPKEIAESFQACCNGYLVKPVQKSEVDACILRIKNNN